MLSRDHGSPIWESLGRTDGRDDGFLAFKCYNPVHVGCDTQCVSRTCALLYTRYPTHSCGGSTACVTTIQLHPLTLDCFCCSLAKAHLSMPATEDRQLTINRFFGFSLVGRSTGSFYNMVAVQIQTHNKYETTHTHATPNVEHDHG